MKNGIPGVSLTPIGISVTAQFVPNVIKYLNIQKQTWPDKQLPPVFVRGPANVSPHESIIMLDSQSAKGSKFICSDIQTFDENNSNCLFSNHFKFRTELQEFGGVGYTKIIQDFIARFDVNGLAEHFSKRPQAILQWREIIEEVIIEGPKWECICCKKLFPEDQMKFEKEDKDFCSMKCIAAFRKKGGFN